MAVHYVYVALFKNAPQSPINPARARSASDPALLSVAHHLLDIPQIPQALTEFPDPTS